jgi:hypothetical protein
MNLDVTLAIEAANPQDALSIASSLQGFKPKSGCVPELIQTNIYGVPGNLTADVQHQHLIGFVKSRLTKLDPVLRGIVAQQEARLTLCPGCSKLRLFGGCLRKNCDCPFCKATRFAGGIDRALKYCYDCCKPEGRCQRCGKVFEQPSQPPAFPGGHIPPDAPFPEQPVMRPGGHIPPPGPRRFPQYRGYCVTYTGQSLPTSGRRGMSPQARERRIAEHQRLTDECAATLRKQHPKLQVDVLAPLLVVVHGKNKRTLSRLPEMVGSFKRGAVQQEAEPTLPAQPLSGDQS